MVHASPLRKAGASLNMGASGVGFVTMPRRMVAVETAETAADVRRRRRERRTGREKAIVSPMAGKEREAIY